MNNQQQQQQQHQRQHLGGADINLEADEEFPNFFNFPHSTTTAAQPQLQHQQQTQPQQQQQQPQHRHPFQIPTNSILVGSYPTTHHQQTPPMVAPSTPTQLNTSHTQPAQQHRVGGQFTVRVTPNLSNKPPTPTPSTPPSAQHVASHPATNSVGVNKPLHYTSNAFSSILNQPSTPPTSTSVTTSGSSGVNSSNTATSSATSSGTNPASMPGVVPGGVVVIGNIKFPANPSLVMMNPSLNSQNTEKKNLGAPSSTPTASVHRTSTGSTTNTSLSGVQSSTSTSQLTSPGVMKSDLSSSTLTTESNSTDEPTTPKKDSEKLDASSPVTPLSANGSNSIDTSTLNDEGQESGTSSGKKGKKGAKKTPGSSSNSNNRVRSKTCKRWTEAQNRALREAVLKYGPRNWKKIAAEIGGQFTADQCNQRWHRVSNPRIIKGDWTPEEDDLLFSLVQEFGESAWTKVAETIPGRTDIQCRHRFFQRKKEIEMGVGRNTKTNSLIQPESLLQQSNVLTQNSSIPQISVPSSSTVGGQARQSTSTLLQQPVSPVSNSGRFVSLLESSPGQIVPSAMLLKQQRMQAEQQILADSSHLPNTEGSIVKEESQPPSMDIADYRKFARQYTNYGKRNGEAASNDMSAFSYVEDEMFDDYTDITGESSDEVFDLNLLADLESENKKDETPSENNKNTSANVNKQTGAYSQIIMDMDDDDDADMLEIDQDDNISASGTAANSSSNLIESAIATNPDEFVHVTLTSSGILETPIQVTIVPLSQDEGKVDTTQITNSRQSKNKKGGKKHTSGTVNRMRGNLNIYIPWSESEETVLKRECLAFGDQVPDFATVLTHSSASFHPLHTPDVLRKHYLQLKAAGIDFNDPIATIPPGDRYYDEVIETELGLLKELKQPKKAKKERKKKEPKEKKERAKKDSDTSDKPKKERKKKESGDSSLPTPRVNKRKSKALSSDENNNDGDEDNIKSTVSGRFGAKRKRSTKQPTKRQKTNSDGEEDDEDRGGQLALFEALNMLGNRVTDNSTPEDSEQMEIDDEDDEVKPDMVSSDQTPGLSPQKQTKHIQNNDNAEILLNFSNFVVATPPNDSVDGDINNGTKLEQQLLANESNMEEKNISFNILPEKQGQSVPVTVSNKVTVGRIIDYLRVKLEVPEATAITLSYNGLAISDLNMKLDDFMKSYDIDTEDLVLHYLLVNN